MATGAATTVWNGSLFAGSGTVTFDSSHAAELPVDWKARAEGSTSVTTPEELLAAAHAACFSMALSNALAENDTPPATVETTAAVDFEPGKGILRSALTVDAEVPGIDPETFARIAEEAKTGCPVSAALRGLEITLTATLR